MLTMGGLDLSVPVPGGLVCEGAGAGAGGDEDGLSGPVPSIATTEYVTRARA